jgi:hypothetical protein
VAYYCVGYLQHTADLPLILGGQNSIAITVSVDASHNNAPRAKSTTGKASDLGAGCVECSSHAQSTVKGSSFESELDGMTSGIKISNHIRNILIEMGVETKTPIVVNDNKAMIEFVKGNGVPKGSKHMELRLYYTKEEYIKGNVELKYIKGDALKADALTKVLPTSVLRRHTIQLQGLQLLDYDYFLSKDSELFQDSSDMSSIPDDYCEMDPSEMPTNVANL